MRPAPAYMDLWTIPALRAMQDCDSAGASFGTGKGRESGNLRNRAAGRYVRLGGEATMTSKYQTVLAGTFSWNGGPARPVTVTIAHAAKSSPAAVR